MKSYTKDFTKQDTIVIIGGSNDNIIGREDALLKEFRNIVEACTHTKMVVAGLPMRHLDPKASDSVDYINMALEKLVSEAPNAVFLPIHELPRHMYTQHGLHFNKRGKRKIARMINETLSVGTVEKEGRSLDVCNADLTESERCQEEDKQTEGEELQVSIRGEEATIMSTTLEAPEELLHTILCPEEVNKDQELSTSDNWDLESYSNSFKGFTTPDVTKLEINKLVISNLNLENNICTSNTSTPKAVKN